MKRALPTGLAVFVASAGAFLAAQVASADVRIPTKALLPPRLEVVVQSGVRGDVNHCPTPDGGPKPDDKMCFFDWDPPLAKFDDLSLPLKGNDKCVPLKKAIAEGLSLEIGCATQVAGKGPKAYKFTVTLRDAAPGPHVVEVKLERGMAWKFGGFKDRRRSVKGDAGGATKPQRAAFLVQLKLAE